VIDVLAMGGSDAASILDQASTCCSRQDRLFGSVYASEVTHHLVNIFDHL
jgi:hypothetical protein